MPEREPFRSPLRLHRLSDETEETLAHYRDTLVQWGEALSAIETHRANALFDASHQLFKLLRDDPDGRAGIAALMADPNPFVRSTAAAHSLLWTPETALETLYALEQDDSVPPEVQINAKYTAIEWRAGRLSFDW